MDVIEVIYYIRGLIEDQKKNKIIFAVFDVSLNNHAP